MAGATLSAGVVLAVAASATPALASTAAPPGGQDGVRGAAADAVSVMDAPRVRPLVTRIVSASARKTYTVRSGDTLSGITGQQCGSKKKWPGVWSQNRAKVKNPDMILPGQRLTFTCEEVTAAMTAAAMAAIPQPAPVVQVAAQVSPVTAVPVHHDQFDGHHGACGDGDGDNLDAPCSVIFGQAPAQQAPVQATAQVTGVSGTVSMAGMGAFQQCVIRAESGGNAAAVNPSSGAGGLYQFLPSTWAALGYSGRPQDASVATQNAAFAKAYAQSGTSPWAPYDGC